jgi:nucleoside permease NupC
MMLIFYIICGCLVFALSGLLMQFNRRAIYRRRIIRHFAAQTSPDLFILSQPQEEKINQCFLKRVSIQECIDQL